MALTSTTLSLAKVRHDRYVKLASVTGIAPKMLIYCEGEYMRVTDTSEASSASVREARARMREALVSIREDIVGMLDGIDVPPRRPKLPTLP